MSGIGILGVGKALPRKCVTNERLQELTGVPASEIERKTGIRTRYVVDDDETASALSAAAAREALKSAAIDPAQIDQIIACTSSGDYVFPAMACRVQELIGAENAGSYDLHANCTGFQIGLGTAADRMRADPLVRYSLVLGTAVQSRHLDWNDPDTAIYVGDGAGAAVLGPVPDGFGIIGHDFFTNPKVYDAVRLRGGGSSHPLRADNIDQGLQYFEMNGLEVWKQVIQYQPKAIRRVLKKIGASVEDVDFFIFHQANLRLIEYLMAKMKLDMSKTYTNVAEYGNTGDASIAIALCDAVREKKIKTGNLVVISGVGAGFTFGATALRWH